MKLDLIVPIVSAIVAAAVSFSVVFLTRRSETIKHLQSIRTTAYVDFIRGVAGLAVVQHEPIQSKEHFARVWELKLVVADARARIAIYGSESVLSSLAEFLRGGSVLDSPQRAKEFTAVCQKMRGDTDSRPKIGQAADRDVNFLLFDEW